MTSRTHWLGLRISTWQHLRFPFSIFLAPVFLFAWSENSDATSLRVLSCFLLLHLGLYPASNGINSYYDQDEGPIGGLEKPIRPGLELLWVSNALEAFAVLGLFIIELRTGILAVLYSAASRAYSHPSTRWKARPYLSLVVVTLCQGALVFYLSTSALAPQAEKDFFQWAFDPVLSLPALASTFLLVSSYPLTQVYQHEEDTRRGDLTLSRVLGVRGTFVFSMAAALLALLLFVFVLDQNHRVPLLVQVSALSVFTLPSTLHLIRWALQCWKSPTPPQYSDAMKLNQRASLGMSVFFLLRILYQTLTQS
jgi:4-hydroxybenzoate polyprenyltransferase